MESIDDDLKEQIEKLKKDMDSLGNRIENMIDIVIEHFKDNDERLEEIEEQVEEVKDALEEAISG